MHFFTLFLALSLLLAPRFSDADFIDSSIGKSPAEVVTRNVGERIRPGPGIGKPAFVKSTDEVAPRGPGLGSQYDANSLFYVYTDKGSLANHYVPSGWMGDFGDLTFEDGNKEDPADGKTCIKVSYSGKGTQGFGWAGIYWQQPENNWGDKPGGYNLSGMKRLSFWARGTRGDEHINILKVGGISGKHPDSGEFQVGPVDLTTTWRHYIIDLDEMNLMQVSGGFAWAASRVDNPNGVTFYLDEMRFER